MEEHGGFRREQGTREAILALELIIERSLDVNLSTYKIFIDLEKTFNKIDWLSLFEILKKSGIDWSDRNIILKFYKNQATLIDINETIEKAKIRKSVR